MPCKQIFGGIAIVSLVLLASPVQAQNGHVNVTGVVVDSMDIGLPGATVVVLTRADSVLTRFATTRGDGSFTLRRVLPDEYILQITFVGYQTFRKDIAVTDSDFDADTITLKQLVSQLDELVVSADHIPFVVKRDTLSYNARAFTTRPNAVVEDLLRRLPGIDVQDDGTIVAQGEEVQNVLVDGKEFFGSDPTIATKNLPAEAVERVQVYDKQSDQAEFTGIADGQEEKTINLELKDDAKQGYFGRVTGGFGGENTEQEVYDGEASINRFSPTTQLALIANVNNVNRPGFAWGDFLNFMGGIRGVSEGMGRGGGGVQIGGDLNDGFSETLAVGVNASHDFAEDTWLRGSYFLSSLGNLQDRVVQQQQLFGSGVSSLINQTGRQSSDNVSHRLNMNVQVPFSEGHNLRLRANLNASASSLGSEGLRETIGMRSLNQNMADTQYDTEGDELGGNGQLTWRKRLSENGRSIVGHARFTLNDSEISTDLSSTTGFYDRGDVVTYEEIMQEQSQFGQTLNHTERLSYTEPLGKGLALEVFGEHSAVKEDQSRNFYDIVDQQSVFNDVLSSGFRRTYTYLRGGLQFSRNKEASWLTLGVRLQRSSLNGTVLDRDERIEDGYTHFLPWAIFRMTTNDGKYLSFQYRTRTREPSITELQPFADNSDPLHVYVGNPALTPEYRHSFTTEYRFFDQFSFINLFTALTVTYTRDQIVASRSVDEQFRQTVTSVNSDEGWTANSALNFGTPIRSLGLQFNLGNNFVYSTGSEFVNEAENRSRILRNTVNFSLDNRAKEIFDIRVGSRLTFNNVNYSLNKELNRSYINSTFYADVDYYPAHVWTINAALNYRIYDQDVFGEGQNVALLEASVSRLLLQDRVEIQLTALDILNQNQGVNFTNSSTFIREERIESLGRYMMLKVIYRLSDFRPGGRKGGRRGGGRRGRNRGA